MKIVIEVEDPKFAVNQRVTIKLGRQQIAQSAHITGIALRAIEIELSGAVNKPVWHYDLQLSDGRPPFTAPEVMLEADDELGQK